MHHSQIGQDRFLDEHVFCGERGGIFVDVGAHDGVTYSNTLFFERERGWSGLCVEPMPEVFERLQANRRCFCERVAIGERDGTCEFLRVRSPHVNTEMLSGVVAEYNPVHLARVDRELATYGGTKEIVTVPLRTLHGLLAEYRLDHVDYLSIDTEGSELATLAPLDLRALGVRAVTVENNYGDPAFATLMAAKGYRLLQNLEYDQVFVPR